MDPSDLLILRSMILVALGFTACLVVLVMWHYTHALIKGYRHGPFRVIPWHVIFAVCFGSAALWYIGGDQLARLDSDWWTWRLPNAAIAAVFGIPSMLLMLHHVYILDKKLNKEKP